MGMTSARVKLVDIVTDSRKTPHIPLKASVLDIAWCQLDSPIITHATTGTVRNIAWNDPIRG
jgi:hypothetical protein